MVVAVEVVWDALWKGYAPLAIDATRTGIAKTALLHEVLAHPAVKTRDPVSQRLALLWITRSLPLIFAKEADARRVRAGFMDDTQSTFLLRRISAEERAARGPVPAVPADFKASLKTELREEILGRKSAHQLVDISRAMQGRTPAKRNATIADLRPTKRQKRAPGREPQAAAEGPSEPAPSPPAPSSPAQAADEADEGEEEGVLESTPPLRQEQQKAPAEAPAEEQQKASSGQQGQGQQQQQVGLGRSSTVLLRADTGAADVRRLAASRSASVLVQPVAASAWEGSRQQVQMLGATVGIMQQALAALTARVAQLEAAERARQQQAKQPGQQQGQQQAKQQQQQAGQAGQGQVGHAQAGGRQEAGEPAANGAAQGKGKARPGRASSRRPTLLADGDC